MNEPKITTMKISKSKLKEVLTQSLNELKNAGEYDNGYRVKIYIENGELGFEVIQSNWATQGRDYLFSLSYRFPYYNNDSRGSVEYMLESGQFEREEDITDADVKEWDWASFCEADFCNEAERLLEEAIFKIENESEHEVA
jgi:hypothetical protein